MVNGPARWLVAPIVLTIVAVLVIVGSSYAFAGGPPLFMASGGSVAQAAPGGRAGFRGDFRGGPPRDGRGPGPEHEDGNLGGLGRMFGKGLLLMGAPAVIAFGASWALFRRTNRSPEALPEENPA